MISLLQHHNFQFDASMTPEEVLGNCLEKDMLTADTGMHIEGEDFLKHAFVRLPETLQNALLESMRRGRDARNDRRIPESLKTFIRETGVYHGVEEIVHYHPLTPLTVREMNADIQNFNERLEVDPQSLKLFIALHTAMKLSDLKKMHAIIFNNNEDVDGEYEDEP
jgi:hypothetical protein